MKSQRRPTEQEEGRSELHPSLPNFNGGPPFVLRRSQQLLTALYSAECRAAGFDLTEPQLDVLRVIGVLQEAPDQTRLGILLGYDRSTISSIIDGLVGRNLVCRVRGDDRRRRTLVQTADAAATLTKGLECAEQSRIKLFKGLSADEIALLLDVLESVATKPGTPAPPLYPPAGAADELDRLEHKWDAAIYRSPRFLFRRCMQTVAAYVAESLPPSGLGSALQAHVLYVIAACGPIDQARIGRMLWIDKSSVSLVVALLESLGMITRSVKPGAGRWRLAAITPRGTERLQIAVRAGERVNERIFEGLPDGTRRQFTRMLTKVVSSHDAFVG